MSLLTDLMSYDPVNEQETIDKKAMIEFIRNNSDYLDRTNLIAHFTSSAIVMNETLDKVLFAHHKIYNSWAWLGGHNDGVEDCLFVAIKEAKEESGIKNVRPLTKAIAGIDTIYVMSHNKNGSYVSDHLHLNLTYILIADETDSLQVSVEENNAVRWFDVEEVFEYVTEPRMIPIYQKMLDFSMKYRK